MISVQPRMKLLRANGCRPTASPIASPIATERAKATASSQNVTRSAAGSPRVSNSVGNDATTREGGLTNIGSTHQRAATSQKKNRRTTTPARATHGRCIVWDVIIAGAFRAPRAPRRAY